MNSLGIHWSVSLAFVVIITTGFCLKEGTLDQQTAERIIGGLLYWLVGLVTKVPTVVAQIANGKSTNGEPK